jgi:hypothetical protein
MNEHRPTPVDISRADLRSGRFQMNPGARPRGKSFATFLWWFAPWSAGYAIGRTIEPVLPSFRALPWWQKGTAGFLAVLIVVLPMCSWLQRRFTQRIADVTAWFLIGFIVGVTA